MTVEIPKLSDTVEHSREWLDENRGEGVSCPSCDQYVKVYRRKINAAMARALILFYKKNGTEWFHLPSAIGYGGDAAKLRYWGFIEEMKELREDGGRAGFWKVTAEGEEWLLGRTKAPKYALVYNGKLLGLDDEETAVIADALGDKFNYNELMNGV